MVSYTKSRPRATRVNGPLRPFPIFWRPWRFGLALTPTGLGGES